MLHRAAAKGPPKTQPSTHHQKRKTYPRVAGVVLSDGVVAHEPGGSLAHVVGVHDLRTSRQTKTVGVGIDQIRSKQRYRRRRATTCTYVGVTFIAPEHRDRAVRHGYGLRRFKLGVYDEGRFVRPAQDARNKKSASKHVRLFWRRFSLNNQACYGCGCRNVHAQHTAKKTHGGAREDGACVSNARTQRNKQYLSPCPLSRPARSD